MYRLCQLWLALSDDASVNRRVGEVVEAAPSAKFVPLVYQARPWTARPHAAGAEASLALAPRRALLLWLDWPARRLPGWQ